MDTGHAVRAHTPNRIELPSLRAFRARVHRRRTETKVLRALRASELAGRETGARF